MPKKFSLLFVVALLFGLSVFVIKLGTRERVILVSGFPNISIYPKAKLVASSENPNEHILFSATWETSSAIPEVSQWYGEELKKTGWTIDVPSGNPNANNIQYLVLYNNAYTLNLSFIRNEPTGKTKIITEFMEKVSDVFEEGEENIQK